MWNLKKIDVLIILSITLAKFFVGFVTGMVIPIFPTLIATDFNESLAIGSNLNATAFGQANSSFNYQKLSILFAVKNLCQIFLSPLFGYLCGLLGSTKILLCGTVLNMSTLLFYGLGNKYYIHILGRISESIANCSTNCAVASFISYQYKDNKKRGLLYGISGLGIAFGGAFGPAFGGVIFQYYGKVVAFLSLFPLNILQIILVIWLVIYFQLEEKSHSKSLNLPKILEIEPNIILPDIIKTVASTTNDVLLTTEPTNGTSEIHNENRQVEESLIKIQNEEKIRTSIDVSSTKSNHNILEFFTDPYFIILIGSMFVMFMTLFMYMATVPRYMRVTFGSTESQQGLIWLLTLVGHVVGFFVGNLMNHKLSKNRHIVLMALIYLHALGSICMALMPTWWSIAIPLCFVVCQQMIYTIVYTPLIAKIVEKKHQSKFGQMSGIMWTTFAIISTTASYLGPILISKIGFLHLNVIILVLGLVYGPLLLLLKRFL